MAIARTLFSARRTATVACMSEQDAMREWLTEMFEQVGTRFDEQGHSLDDLGRRIDELGAALGQRLDSVESQTRVLIDTVAEIKSGG